MEFERGNKCGLMVAREFSSLLDGVDYVDKHVFEGAHHDVGSAFEQAKQISGDCTCVQINCSTEQVKQYVYGPAGLQTAVTTSFQKESWRVAGRLAWWDDQPALTFKRDAVRETALVRQHIPPGKRLTVLYSLGGVSSPFPMAGVVRALLKAHLGSTNYRLIDLGSIQAERFYDLLGLYDRAHCLIATDSAPLHLARACPQLPVLAFAQDKTPDGRALLWHGSPWRPNHVFYCRYSDFAARVDEFIWALDNLYGIGFRPEAGTRQLVHVYSEYGGPVRRNSWYAEYKQSGQWNRTPIEVGACGRDSAMILQDPQRLPYLKDSLRMGLQRASKDDLVVLSRPDTEFLSGISYALTTHPLSFAYRLDVKGGRKTFRPVADLFCAPKSWWVEQLPKIPDFILGKDIYWPHALWGLFNQAAAKDLTGWVYREKGE